MRMHVRTDRGWYGARTLQAPGCRAVARPDVQGGFGARRLPERRRPARCRPLCWRRSRNRSTAPRGAAADWPGCRAREDCPTNAIAKREAGTEGYPTILVADGCAREG